MASLDMVDMREVFQRCAVIMRTVSVFLKRAFKTAFRVAVEERLLGETNGEFHGGPADMEVVHASARMILFRPPRGGKVPRKQLEERTF